MVKYAVICASNQNRSMEAHNVLSKKGFNVHSYGTGTMVRLPGPAIDKPNIYPFGTPYDSVYQELKAKDPQLYTQNGLLSMLDRNRKIKEAPQRWADSVDMYDVIITCEERCFDAVFEDLTNRGEESSKSTHLINVDIKDNHEDALLGGRAILQLAQMIEASKDIDNDIQTIIEKFAERYPTHPILHTIAYY
ncbi:RNA polymerase II subunit A C-terminal domain phosphatase SSU72 [Umbelopsis sp. PMI_123]|nr:RNA polymerase II subunit A C-terminal domain phosphatase SSU72 [Umbelopsis sp. PMI_123]